MWLNPEVLISQGRCHPPTRRSVQESDLNEKWLVDFFDRVGFFSKGSGQCIHSYRAALIFLDNRKQQSAIHFVETVAVYFEHLQRGLRGGQIDFAVATHLGVITHPS